MSIIGEYLKQLRKDKKITQQELADKSGVSGAEISRIETGNRKHPSPVVLKQLAPHLQIKHEQLLEKAGYLDDYDRIPAFNKRRENKDKFLSLIIPILMKEGWGIKADKRHLYGYIIAIRNSDEWHIDYKELRSNYNKHFRTDMAVRQILTQTYGRLVLHTDETLKKYTIAISDETVFQTICKYKPAHLKIVISIMLIDLEENKLLQEHFY